MNLCTQIIRYLNNNYLLIFSGEQCAAQLEVCCLLPLNSLNDTSLPVPTFIGGGSSGSRPPATSSPISTQTDGTAGTTENPYACRCVLQSQCLNTTDPISGAGNIDVR